MDMGFHSLPLIRFGCNQLQPTNEAKYFSNSDWNNRNGSFQYLLGGEELGTIMVTHHTNTYEKATMFVNSPCRQYARTSATPACSLALLRAPRVPAQPTLPFATCSTRPPECSSVRLPNLAQCPRSIYSMLLFVTCDIPYCLCDFMWFLWQLSYLYNPCDVHYISCNAYGLMIFLWRHVLWFIWCLLHLW